MVEEINAASSKLSSTHQNSTNANSTNGSDDPLSQIVRVLNGHLTQLQAIDQGAAGLQREVQTAKREAGDLEQGMGERFELGGDSVGAFGRSYLGRGR